MARFCHTSRFHLRILRPCRQTDFPFPFEQPFFLVLIFVIGYQTLWHGLKALATLNFKSIQALMLIAVCGAWLLGKYEEAAVVIVLYTLAEKLEDIGIAKSQSAMNALFQQMPKLVFVKAHGQSDSDR